MASLTSQTNNLYYKTFTKNTKIQNFREYNLKTEKKTYPAKTTSRIKVMTYTLCCARNIFHSFCTLRELGFSALVKRAEKRDVRGGYSLRCINQWKVILGVTQTFPNTITTDETFYFITKLNLFFDNFTDKQFPLISWTIKWEVQNHDACVVFSSQTVIHERKKQQLLQSFLTVSSKVLYLKFKQFSGCTTHLIEWSLCR